MKISCVISAGSEWRAVKSLLSIPSNEVQLTPFGEYFLYQHKYFGIEVKFFHQGYGKVAAASATQYVIDNHQPNLIINLGTCGGFSGRTVQGELFLVEKTIIYDVLDSMGFQYESIKNYTTSLDLSKYPLKCLSRMRKVLMLTADRDIVPEQVPSLIKNFDGVVGDWESGAIAWVCDKNKTDILIIRGVSDLVSETDGQAYDEDGTFFKEACTKIMELLLRKFHELLSELSGSKYPEA
jgi:adenosylhomocysteine nucleosidase